MEGLQANSERVKRRPVVSVLMTVYNGERYLAEAVDSILSQTFEDFEFIIVDDGSTDGSLELLGAFERRDPRIRLFARPHAGIVPAANFGLRQCRGEFIARMDSDDVALPHRFEVQVQTLREHADAVVVGGAYDLIDAAGRFLRRQWPPMDDPSLQELSLCGLTPICQPLAMMRKSALDQVGEYDRVVETAEDNDMWLRLGEVGRLMCVPEVLLKYRQHANSVSEVKALAQAERIRIGCEKAYARRHVQRTFRPPPAWRPSGEQSRYMFLCQYGWWAFRHAQRSTAIIYGLKAVQKQPLNRKGWSLLMTSLLKPMPVPPDGPGAVSGRSGLAA
jgi:glycosyltransferase involved in cell wall biosynthesis